jgi:aspartate carbamoyltransferase catalytic subunit
MSVLKKREGIQHIIDSRDFSHDFLIDFFKEVKKIEKVVKSCDSNFLLPLKLSLRDKIIALLFYIPSTRTRMSFESAIIKLGGSKISTENAKDFSSAAKGETLEDTIRVIGKYVDGIVLRHHEEGAAQRAANVSSVPIINAGDGPGQHPTQTLLDLYTIYNSFEKIDGLKIALLGGLSNNRAVRSLAYSLAEFEGVEIFFCSPEYVKIKQDVKDFLKSKGVLFKEVNSLSEIYSSDVVYVTRIQEEYFKDKKDCEEIIKEYKKFYINNDVIENFSNNSLIMHPLPRGPEINPEIDENKRSIYFEQAENGLYVRMALLKHIFT